MERFIPSNFHQQHYKLEHNAFELKKIINVVSESIQLNFIKASFQR